MARLNSVYFTRCSSDWNSSGRHDWVHLRKKSSFLSLNLRILRKYLCLFQWFAGKSTIMFCLFYEAAFFFVMPSTSWLHDCRVLGCSLTLWWVGVSHALLSKCVFVIVIIMLASMHARIHTAFTLTAEYTSNFYYNCFSWQMVLYSTTSHLLASVCVRLKVRGMVEIDWPQFSVVQYIKSWSSVFFHWWKEKEPGIFSLRGPTCVWLCVSVGKCVWCVFRPGLF